MPDDKNNLVRKLIFLALNTTTLNQSKRVKISVSCRRINQSIFFWWDFSSSVFETIIMYSLNFLTFVPK